jgi:predicted flap endonuclease-1-like 5' DNA nuclease
MMQILFSNPLLSIILVLIGGIIGWLLRAFLREQALKDDFMMRDQERIHLAAANNQLKNVNDLKDADLRRVNLELQQMQEQANHFDQERQLHLAAVQSAAQKMQSTQQDLQSNNVKILTFDEQVLGLRTRNAQLTGELNQMREVIKTFEHLHTDFVSLQHNNLALEEAIAQIEHERNQSYHEIEAANLEIENLQGEILKKTSSLALNKSAMHQVVESNGISKSSAIQKIGDDLKIINGVGPFTEKKLHDMGIYTFAQLADMSEATVENLNESLGLYKGKIKKEGWINQAKHLIEVEVGA